MKIGNSASRIVFLLLTVTACVSFLFELLPVDQFMLLAMAAYSFYFTKTTPPTGGS